MFGVAVTGGIKFACSVPVSLSFGEEFMVLMAPTAARPRVSILPRRENKTSTLSEIAIAIEEGDPTPQRYVVVKQEGNGDGSWHYEALPTACIEQVAKDTEMSVVDSLTRLTPRSRTRTSPLQVINSKVRIDHENMVVDHAYRITYRGRNRLFIRNSLGEVEVYRAKG